MKERRLNGRIMGLQHDEHSFEEMISFFNLRKNWNTVRKLTRESQIRDCVDWLDWAICVENNLSQISKDLLNGDYCPEKPMRYELAKSKGAFRVMTQPNIRDTLIYHVICEKALKIAMPMKVPGAYFSRRHQITPIGKTVDNIDDPSSSFWAVWLRYQQYRTHTMLNKIYNVLVITDITNYFDSISHELLMEYLSPLGLPRKAVGLLGRLLEALKPTAGHSSNPRIGIPVDESDCSRTLAHIFLFEHDRRMAKKYGKENYVRWMDDQNIGARNYTDARRIVNTLNHSLMSQRLTLNSGKTLFLEPTQVVEHFQLDANEALEKWNQKYKRDITSSNARHALKKLWVKLCKGDTYEKGCWDKILKRFYACSARSGINILDKRMYDDLVNYPHLADRIFISLARRNMGDELVTLFKKYCKNGESLYDSIEAIFFESCLLLNADTSTEKTICELAEQFCRGNLKGQSQKPYGKATAILCLYWFNYQKGNLPNLFTSSECFGLPAAIARAWLSITAAIEPGLLPKIQCKLVGHPYDDVARFSKFLTELISGEVNKFGSYKNLKERWPAQGKFYDTRAWLQFELLSISSSKELIRIAQKDFVHFRKYSRTRQEKRVLNRARCRFAT